MKKPYFYYLDALRFFAFLAVFLAHTGTLFPIAQSWFATFYHNVLLLGVYGVNFFFVLSGFLITYLLLKEKTETGTINIKHFYIKRVLRIWPVYFAVFFIAACALPLFVRSLGVEHVALSTSTFPNLSMTLDGQAIWWFVLLVGNFFGALQLGQIPFALGVLWSVCVEEQFYIVWPLIIKYFRKTGALLCTLLLMIGSLVYKYIYIDNYNILHYSTFSVVFDLAFGSLVAFIYMAYAEKIQLAFRNLFKVSKKSIAHLAIGVVVLIAYIWASYIGLGGNSVFGNMIHVVEPIIADTLFATLILYFVMRDRVDGESERLRTRSRLSQAFSYLGKISYGLYGYHAICMITIIALLNYIGVTPHEVGVIIYSIFAAISLGLSILVAHISFAYMEKRFHALRQKFLQKTETV